MNRQALYLKTLRQAAQVIGGIEGLGKRLAVSKAVLAGWLAEIAPVPESIFLKAVDLLQEHELRVALRAKAMPPRRGERKAQKKLDG
jgi:hypothetical protein